ncbi:hypothetical protein G7Z17_g2284 [Cylindrodendrum hubeiense]|uniref:Enoyl reductase (ER) domain-containing protein n=1 Tax=Cylindrodendrum hubeiense TaxID=595255 RepID=A0A9P5HJ45_9HYPO|nr:hypothetical protein G7Z17_g2284 [Cylindrodendrum hubeiense]
MSTHTVYRFTSRNGFDGLQAFQEPIPVAGKYEVLVKVRSVALNYRDVAIANSTYPVPVKDLVIPCSDMAGEVVQVGELADGFSIGDRVISPVSHAMLYGPAKDHINTLGGLKDGVLREYIALPAHATIKLPKSSHSFAQWASLVTTGGTAWNSLYGLVPLKPGQTVLVLGTGGVSLTALILAKAAGATVIITSSSDDKLEHVKSKYGADYTINYNTHPNWGAEVQRITNGQGVDNVIEISGTGTIEKSIEAVAWGGIVSVIGFLTTVPKEEMPDVTLLTLLKGATLRAVLSGSKQQLEDAVAFMGSRELQMPVDKTFGFNRDEIIEALKYVESGKHIGKDIQRLGQECLFDDPGDDPQHLPFDFTQSFNTSRSRRPRNHLKPVLEQQGAFETTQGVLNTPERCPGARYQLNSQTHRYAQSMRSMKDSLVDMCRPVQLSSFYE